MNVPEVEYARSGDVSIAYQTVGSAPIDVVFVRGFAGDLLSAWEQPRLVRFIEGLAEFSRVILMDKRGTGLSDRVREVPTLETRMDDVRAVLDDLGAQRALLWTAQEGARLAALFAATYPERVLGLVLFDPTAKGLRSADYPWARTQEQWFQRLREIREGWGRTAFLDVCLAEWSPRQREDAAFRAWFHSHMRRGLSPGSALAFFRMMMESDVSDVLAAVRVPTVVLSSHSQRGPSTYFAERVPGARLVDLPSVQSIYHWVDEDASEMALRETRKLTDVVDAGTLSERTLATVLFTDIARSTDHAATLGDREWAELLERHHAVVRNQLDRFRGRELDTAGDGFLASFDGPARAVACAASIIDEVEGLGLAIRAGVHTGECEQIGSKLGGISVHVGARIMALAQPGEILVSSVVRDLVAGSGIAFSDRGAHTLKGVPHEMRLYAATRPTPSD